MWAAYKGRTEVAQLLLEKGANPNITGQVPALKPNPDAHDWLPAKKIILTS